MSLTLDIKMPLIQRLSVCVNYQSKLKGSVRESVSFCFLCGDCHQAKVFVSFEAWVHI